MIPFLHQALRVPFCLLMLTLLWAAYLWWPLYPVPFRDIGDEVWYLGGALQMLERGEYYRNIMYNDFDGGELRLMAALNQPLPLHRHILPYHFPGFSAWLLGFYTLSGDFFWTLALSQSLLLVTVVLLTFRLGLCFGLTEKLSAVAALLLMANPSISYFTPNVLPELLLVALALGCLLLGAHTRKAHHHALLALLLTALVLTRYGFLPLVMLIIFWQIGRSWQMKQKLWPLLFYALPFALHFSIGQNGFLFYRPPAAKCVLDTDFASLVLNTVENLSYFWQGALLTSSPYALQSKHQDYIYAALLLVFVLGRSYRHHALFSVSVLGLFAALGGTLVFCSWWGWQHVRLCLWFMPIAYILGMRLLQLLWKRGGNAKYAAAAFALFCAWTLPYNLYYTLEKLKAESEKGATSYHISAQAAPWIATHAKPGELVSVPLFSMALTALIDPTRTYAVRVSDPMTFWAATQRDTSTAPDVIILKDNDTATPPANAATQRFMESYAVQPDRLTVMIPGDDKPTTLVALRRQ